MHVMRTHLLTAASWQEQCQGLFASVKFCMVENGALAGSWLNLFPSILSVFRVVTPTKAFSEN